MQTHIELAAELRALREENKTRDALLLKVVGKVKALEENRSNLANRLLPIVPPFPDALRDLGIAPPKEMN